jgi:type I restriction enzyme M protein
VLDDKWHATIASLIAATVNSVTLNLVGRIQQLGERYEETVNDLDAEIAKLESKVAQHLAAMGVK